MHTNDEPRQRFTSSDGISLAYAVDDYTDRWKPAETLIMVHAAMGSSRRFYAWVPYLAREFRVVRPDSRGHGLSAITVSDEISATRVVKDVIELADHLGCERFHIMGSSAGGVVAQKVAIDHPDRVMSLGVFAAAPGIKHGNQDQATWVTRIGERGIEAFLRETIADRVDNSKVDPGFIDWFISDSARTSVEPLARYVLMMKKFDILDEVSGIVCPTLAVAPGADPIKTVDHYRLLEKKIRNCTFKVYDGLPHNITDAVPDRCAADLLEFLKSQKHP
jgi:3-oxoadipate enol-lactonase